LSELVEDNSIVADNLSLENPLFLANPIAQWNLKMQLSELWFSNAMR
jgi:hypothetical protein